MNFQSVDQIVIGLLSTTAFMTVLWLIQWKTGDAGIVDVGWSASLGLLALFYGLTQANPSSRTLLVTGIASLWSFRLAMYLLRDRILGKTEDGRYQEIRSRLGRRPRTRTGVPDAPSRRTDQAVGTSIPRPAAGRGIRCISGH